LRQNCPAHSNLWGTPTFVEKCRPTESEQDQSSFVFDPILLAPITDGTESI
jgi:hypothetical protein